MAPADLLLPLLSLYAVYATKCGHSELTETDKNDLLKIHNEMRSSLASGEFVAGNSVKSPASDMQMLQWDCELEKSAQRYANTCPTTGHSSKQGVGENMYWVFSTIADISKGTGKDAANNWAKEFQQKGWPNGKFDLNMFNRGIGHATQMVWAKTNKIGCGKKLCRSTEPGFPYSIVIVCHYSPQGNILGSDVYTAAASRCSNVRWI